jgi:hypothetical protein
MGVDGVRGAGGDRLGDGKCHPEKRVLVSKEREREKERREVEFGRGGWL